MMRSILPLAGFVWRALALCECGYSVNSTNSSSYAVFTELIESDFLHLSKVGSEYGWQPEEYSVTAAAARGTLGKQAELSNVIPNPLKDSSAWSGSGINGGDAGLQLWVRANDSDGMVPIGEIDGTRDDMLYGSFRVGMKLSPVNGTCGAFFWYRNDSQEIDIELLSRQFSTNNSTINLVLQSPESDSQGYNAAGTPYYQTPSLPYDPSAEFHEYRFDWTPGTVTFYADGQLLAILSTENISYNDPGHIIMNHWSNGNQGWSGGPPTEDAVLTVMYVKTYFNSSNPLRASYRQNCPTYDPSKVCQIPDQLTPPSTNSNSTPPTYFFSIQSDQIPGQSTDNTTWSATGQRNAGTRKTVPLWPLTLAVLVGFALFFR